jgi:hypothetical protein
MYNVLHCLSRPVISHCQPCPFICAFATERLLVEPDIPSSQLSQELVKYHSLRSRDFTFTGHVRIATALATFISQPGFVPRRPHCSESCAPSLSVALAASKQRMYRSWGFISVWLGKDEGTMFMLRRGAMRSLNQEVFQSAMPTLRVRENFCSLDPVSVDNSVYAVAYIAYNSDPAYTGTTSILRPPPCNTWFVDPGDCAATFERHDVASFETMWAVMQGLYTLRDTPLGMMQKIIPASFGYDFFYHTRHHSHHLPFARSMFAMAST